MLPSNHVEIVITLAKKCSYALECYDTHPVPVYMYVLCFLHASSTIDAEHLAVDPFTVLGGEEADNAGDVDGLADAVHWGPGSGVLDFSLAFYKPSGLFVIVQDLPHPPDRR